MLHGKINIKYSKDIEEKLESAEVKQNNYFGQRKWIHSGQLSAKQEGTKWGIQKLVKIRNRGRYKIYKEKKRIGLPNFSAWRGPTNKNNKILKAHRREIPWKTNVDRELRNDIRGLYVNTWRRTGVCLNKRGRRRRRRHL